MYVEVEREANKKRRRERERERERRRRLFRIVELPKSRARIKRGKKRVVRVWVKYLKLIEATG